MTVEHGVRIRVEISGKVRTPVSITDETDVYHFPPQIILDRIYRINGI